MTIMFARLSKILLLNILLVCTEIALANDSGYIKHQFINKTPYECYMSVRQQYTYPIEACVGPVAANGTKTCDGAFEPQQPNFFFVVICSDPAARLELDKLVFLRNTYKNPNIDVVWTIEIAKKKLKMNYHEHGF
jgi:hypothetical protein